MESEQTPFIVGNEGLRGRLMTPLVNEGQTGGPVLIALEDGQQIQIPANMIVRQADGSYYIPLSPSQLRQEAVAETEHVRRQEAVLVVPVVQEELKVQKRTVETARARISKHVQEREEVIDEPLMRQEVAIEHVPINRVWEGPAPPARYEGDKLIVPLLAEVLVVEKRLMLKEELHISRIQKTVHEPQTVVLRSEDVTVERVEPTTEASEAGRLAT